MSIATNLIFSDRPLLSMFKSLLDHLIENVFPVKNIKWSIEGYWPGFQQDYQSTDGLDKNKIAQSMYYIILKPQLFEIDERINFTWRLESPRTFGLVRHLYKPVIETENYSCYLKYLRLKGNFDIEILGPSLPYIIDVHMGMLTRFNNKFTYIKMKPYSQLIPLVISSDNLNDSFDGDNFWNELINSSQVNYAYVGLTGEKHFVIERILNSPLLKLTGSSSSYDPSTLMYTYTISFEYFLQYPAYWLIFEKSTTHVIYTHITYEDISSEQILAASDQSSDNNNVIKRFIPYGNVKLYDLVNVLMVYAPDEPKVFRALYFKGTESFLVNVNVQTQKISNSMYQLNVSIEDEHYLENPELINTHPVILEYGVHYDEKEI